MADVGGIGLEELQRNVLGDVMLDIAALGTAGTAELLERAQELPLGGLGTGGGLMFPHLWARDCGYQTAACAQACLDSGADTVVVLGVLHPSNDDMDAAVARVATAGKLSGERYRGIQGPGLDTPEDWRREHSLLLWRYLWDAEIERRGLARSRSPRVIERYPFLCGGEPSTLPGIEELEELARDAVVVATGDLFHHGVAFETPAAECLEPTGRGLAVARRAITDGIELLADGDYRAFERHCRSTNSDGADVLEVLHVLRPRTQGRVVDLAVSDLATLYPEARPSWVASALLEWAPV